MSSGNGAVALVTGGERGIGRECARQLAERGYTVVIGALDLPLAERTVGELAGAGSIEALALDVTDDVSISAALDAIAARHGRLDVLVNNAGITGIATPTDISRAQLRGIFEVNLFGAVLVTAAALPLLALSPAGRVVNVSSGGGSLTRCSEFARAGGRGADILAYAASKAALNMATVQTCISLGADPAYRNLKVNAVGPGTTATAVSGFVGQPPSEAARILVQLATLDADGPTGGFFDAAGPVPW